MPVWVKRLAWVVLILGLVFVTAVVLFVVEPWRHDETTGLTLIDSWKTDYRSSPLPIAGDSWSRILPPRNRSEIQIWK